MASVSIDRVIDQLAPWDLKITVDGVEYQTKALTLGDLAVLTGALGGGQLNLPALIEVLEGMFHITPPVRKWSLETVMVVVQTIVDYFGARSKKNQSAIQAAVKRHSTEAPPAATEDPSAPPTSGS
jgi:hypothetical protein